MPDCRQEARGYHPGSLAEELLAQFPDARAMVLFPSAPGARPRPVVDGRAHETRLHPVALRRRIVDLHDQTSLPETRTSGIHVIVDRLVLRPDNRHRLIEAIEVAFQEAEGLCHVDVIGQGLRTYSTHFVARAVGEASSPLRPLLFSFNHPLGACPECKGTSAISSGMTGTSSSPIAASHWPVVPSNPGASRVGLVATTAVARHEKRMDVDLTTPFQDLSPKVQQLIWEGSEQVEGIRQYFDYLETKRYKLHVRVLLSRLPQSRCLPHMPGQPTQTGRAVCEGDRARLRPAQRLTIEAAAAWFARLALPAFDAEVAKDILRQLENKLNFLLRVGLGCLTLSRQTKTPVRRGSAAHRQANQLGSRLVGTLYVLDNPRSGSMRAIPTPWRHPARPGRPGAIPSWSWNMTRS